MFDTSMRENVTLYVLPFADLPSAGLDGDIFFTSDTSQFYMGQGGGLPLVLIGPGAGGGSGSILNGTVDPVGGDGVDGDFWINTTSNYIFGPKASGVWPAGVSLVGPAGAGSAPDWGDITGTLSAQTDLQAALDAKVDENGAIVGATKTKITYDTKGLVTAGADATKADIGLSSVDNVQQMPLSYLDTDGTLAANSDVKVASQKATKTYVDAHSGASAWGGITGTLSSQTDLQAALDAKLDDSQLDTDGTLATNSDAKIASQKATKTYVDGHIGAIGVAGITMDGGGITPGTGSKGYIQIPYAATILSWTLMADTSGTADITVKKCSYAGFPGSLSSIVAGSHPSLTSQQINTDSSLSGWTISISAGDILEFYLNSVGTSTKLFLELKLQKT